MIHLLKCWIQKRETKYQTKVITFIQKYFDNDNKKVIEPTIVKNS